MARLQEQLGKNTGSEPYDINPLAVLEAVRTQEKGGLFLDPIYPAGGYTQGNKELGTAMIAFRWIDTGPFSDWSNGDVGLHEITHEGRRTGSLNSHTQMAQAAYDVAQAMGLLRPDSKPRVENIPKGLSAERYKQLDNAASNEFEGKLFDACSGKR